MTTYAPPPGPPPDKHYAPPAGSPPAWAPQQHYPPPPGAPPSDSYAAPPSESRPQPPSNPPRSTAPSGEPSTEPPPPYTANAADPLPSWAQACTRVRDLSATYPSLALAHLPLDPPPDFFSTPSPRRVRSRSFAAWTVPSRARNLVDGFPVLYNDALKAHGVSEEDWGRFIGDVQVAARLALAGFNMRGERQRRASLSGTLLGSVRGRAYDAAFAKSPLEQVQQLVEIYNGSAWERRKVHVTVRMQLAENGREGYELLVEAL
ncbi:hypothetical protein PsYK624_101820 [Phanerochaete sordida]|uniref:Uncharacterized protein n=1 Tax=Phanerochaete sordida TaxID=48140 RepID=A0A9P3LGU8_9APHY|nr:hypothetical protein PsYK624_101820 [Phanerochaete sordida]